MHIAHCREWRNSMWAGVHWAEGNMQVCRQLPVDSWQWGVVFLLCCPNYLRSCLIGSLALVSQLVCPPILVQSLTKKPTSSVCIRSLPAKVIPLFVRHYSEYLRHDVCVFMQLRVVRVCSCEYVCAYVHVCLSVHTCVQTYASLRFLCVSVCGLVSYLSGKISSW